MLSYIFWYKSPCHGIGLKSVLQVVSYEHDLKNKSVSKGYTILGVVKEFKCCYTDVIIDFQLYLEPKKDFKNYNIYLIML